MTSKRNTATETYITYAPETDMTFIMKQVIDIDTMEAISDECVGWYYGKITLSEALNLPHNLKAVYVDDADVDSKATENEEFPDIDQHHPGRYVNPSAPITDIMQRQLDEVLAFEDVDSKATENMEYFRELFLEEAQRFAAQNDGFDAYEALDQVLDCDDICNDIHRATRDEIPNIVEYAADHYIW